MNTDRQPEVWPDDATPAYTLNIYIRPDTRLPTPKLMSGITRALAMWDPRDHMSVSMTWTVDRGWVSDLQLPQLVVQFIPND